MNLNKVQGLFGTLKILSARHHRTYLTRILFIYFCLSWEQITWYFNNHNITSFELKVISQVLSQLKGNKSHLSFWDLRIHGILRNFMGTTYPKDSTVIFFLWEISQPYHNHWYQQAKNPIFIWDSQNQSTYCDYCFEGTNNPKLQLVYQANDNPQISFFFCKTNPECKFCSELIQIAPYIFVTWLIFQLAFQINNHQLEITICN